nr:ABC transporter substrate binding protein [uncultured Desulfobacter sp.]
MNRRKNRCLMMFVLFICLVSFNSINASPKKIYPVLNKGKKWKIAYYEGGPYADYQTTLKATIQGLVQLGWLSEVQFPDNIDTYSNKEIWNYLAHKAKSRYLEFLPDVFLSADWKTERRIENKHRMLCLLNETDAVDMVFALGTWAGKDLANNDHSTPVIIMSTSDPVGAGIIESPEDSGYDHIFARCDPNRFTRQIRFFHRISEFKKLGVIYANTESGKAISSIEDIEKISRERNFEVVHCHIHDSERDTDEIAKEYASCLNKIIPQIDAFLITGILATQPKYIHNYVPILIEHKVPSWSLVQDLSLIKQGIMMCLIKKDFYNLGLFQAKAIASVLNGVKPRKLRQVFEDIDTIAINTKTAELIEFKIPTSILRQSDVTFDTIE